MMPAIESIGMLFFSTIFFFRFSASIESSVWCARSLDEQQQQQQQHRIVYSSSVCIITVD